MGIIWDMLQDALKGPKPKAPGPELGKPIGMTPGGPIHAPANPRTLNPPAAPPSAPSPEAPSGSIMSAIRKAWRGDDDSTTPPVWATLLDAPSSAAGAPEATLSTARGLHAQLMRGEMKPDEGLRVLDRMIRLNEKNPKLVRELLQYRNTFQAIQRTNPQGLPAAPASLATARALQDPAIAENRARDQKIINAGVTYLRDINRGLKKGAEKVEDTMAVPQPPVDLLDKGALKKRMTTNKQINDLIESSQHGMRSYETVQRMVEIVKNDPTIDNPFKRGGKEMSLWRMFEWVRKQYGPQAFEKPPKRTTPPGLDKVAEDLQATLRGKGEKPKTIDEELQAALKPGAKEAGQGPEASSQDLARIARARIMLLNGPGMDQPRMRSLAQSLLLMRPNVDNPFQKGTKDYTLFEGIRTSLLAGGGVALLATTGADKAEAAEAPSAEAPSAKGDREVPRHDIFNPDEYSSANAAREAAADERENGPTASPGLLGTVAEMGEGGAKLAMHGEDVLAGRAEPDEMFSSLTGMSEETRQKLRYNLKLLLHKDPNADFTDAEKRTWSGLADMINGFAESTGAPLIAAATKVMEVINPHSSKEDNAGLAQFVLSATPFAIFMRHLHARTPGGPRGAPRAPTPVHLFVRAAGHNTRALFSPHTVSTTAEKTSAIIREQTGIAARQEEVSRYAMTRDDTQGWWRRNWNSIEKRIATMPDTHRLAFQDYIENRTAHPVAFRDPVLNKIANELRHAMINRRVRLENTQRHANASFVDDYLAHFWDDPARTAAFRAYWSSVQGTTAGGHLRKRTVPTIMDGINYGLRLISTNPIDVSMRYIAQIERYLAHINTHEVMESNGLLLWRPTQGRTPGPGWVGSSGRYSTRGGMTAYMPEDAARVYNRFASIGFHGEYTIPAYEVIHRTMNGITGLELSMSGFHAVTMSIEAPMSQFATALAQVVGAGHRARQGDLGAALKLLGGAAKRSAEAIALPLAAGAAGAMAPVIGGASLGVAGLLLSGGVLRTMRGDRAMRIYLGRTTGSHGARHIVDVLTRGGARMTGKRHELVEYNFSPLGSTLKQLQRLGPKGMGRETLRRIQRPRSLMGRDVGKYKYLVNVPKEGVGQLAALLDTIAAPIFDLYIPRLKNGVMVDMMGAWIHANPGASVAEQIAMARKVVDSVDNRFGEMVQDNIFWDKHVKQIAMCAMRSFSWTLGEAREIGGGYLGLIQSGGKGMAITAGKRGAKWDPRTNYVVALPILSGILGGAYSYIKTGRGPGDYSAGGLLNYLFAAWAPQTGGQSPGAGGRGEVPELAMLPGYMKDVFGFLYDPLGESENKVGTGPRLLWQSFTGENWRGGPIIKHWDPSVEQRVGDYLSAWVYGNDPQLGPISIRNWMRGEKTGSRISVIEQLMGIRPASMWLEDRQGVLRARHHRFETERKREERFERKRDWQYGND